MRETVLLSIFCPARATAMHNTHTKTDSQTICKKQFGGSRRVFISHPLQLHELRASARPPGMLLFQPLAETLFQGGELSLMNGEVAHRALPRSSTMKNQHAPILLRDPTAGHGHRVRHPRLCTLAGGIHQPNSDGRVLSNFAVDGS